MRQLTWRLKVAVLLPVLGMLYAGTMAQQPVYQVDFDRHGQQENTVAAGKASAKSELLPSQYVNGVSGRALDLSANASLRRPVKLDSARLPSYGANSSFTVQIWVKTLPGAIMGTPVMGNKKSDDQLTPSWQIYTRENGAWALQLNDGKNKYDYRPTAQRQKINDGKWHQLVLAVDRKKQEVWLYMDGKNVAVYNTPELGDLTSGLATIAGGADDKWEYGTAAQWYAFNGYIDDVKFWKEIVAAEQVAALYKAGNPGEKEEVQLPPAQLKFLAWNIWHGGHRFGQEVGVQRTIEILRGANADIIGLVETYGSGEVIADSLGYYFYLISSNLSILSRYPIKETIKAFKPFNFGGAKIALAGGKEILFFNTWLHYLPGVSDSLIREKKSGAEIAADEGPTRHQEIKDILREISPLLQAKNALPVVMSGDFNSGSHLDWTEATKGIHFGQVIEWPVSREMINAGFKDSYRELHINPLLDPGLTWSPVAATSSARYGLRNRIDYIYYKSEALLPVSSAVIDYHPVMFPSDHAAVTTVFKLIGSPEQAK